jgi:hypothetical protein
MSVREEIEELVKWLADLTAEDEPAVETKTLPHEDWRHVRDDLRDVSTKFGLAHRALPGSGKGIVAAEFADDLARQAESLQFRAQVLSRRALPPPNKAKPKATQIRPAAKPANSAVAAGVTIGTTETDPKEQTAVHTPVDLVESASVQLEHARRKLDALEHPDVVTQAFEDELDVLTEMTLSLRQLCERVAEEQEHPASSGRPEPDPQGERR